MKLVEATSGLSGVLCHYNVVSGIFASILAIFMLTGSLYYLQYELDGFIQLLDVKALLVVFGQCSCSGDPVVGDGYRVGCKQVPPVWC